MKQIKIKLQDRDLIPPHFIKQGNWVDLRCASKEQIYLKSGEFKLIPLGVAMELPKGYEAHLVPRSSTFKNFGIIQANSIGIIDSSYCGDNDYWFFPALAIRDTVINFNDRICQFRIMPTMKKNKFIIAEHLSHRDRGGHGSTGIR